MDQSSTDLIEKIIISCMYNKPKLAAEVFVKEEYFKNPYNRLVFKLSLEYFKEHQNLDVILVFQEYQKELGNNFIDYLTEVITLIATTTVFTEYQEKLFEIYKNDWIVKYVAKFQKKEIKQDQLFDALDKIKNMTSNQNYQFLSEEEIYHIITQTDKRINFRLSTLNETIKLSEHDLCVIGARTGVGKTGFALNLLEDISNEYKCLYFNMEMSEQQILRRLVAINSKVPISKLTNPDTDYQKDLIKASVKNIANKKMKIFTGVQTVTSIKQTIIKESKKEHIVVFIDYVGLIAGYNNNSQYERVTKIVKEIRQISLNFDCTIICLSQINRNGDDAPMLKDLKDSGELEQSAVSAILLHNQNQNKDVKNPIEELEAIVAKNRNGQTGVIKVEYNKSNQQFNEQRRF